MDVKVTFVLFVAGFLLGCDSIKGEDDCGPKEVRQISLTNSDWFNGVKSFKTMDTYSDKGRSESFDLVYYGHYLWGENKECVSYEWEVRELYYKSSIYKRGYEFKIAYKPQGDLLSIEATTSFGNAEKWEISMSAPLNCSVTYKLPATTTSSNGIKNIPIQIVDSIVLNNGTFRNVYKIDVEESTYSIDKTTKIMYFDPKYGIIKLETFNGEVWTLF